MAAQIWKVSPRNFVETVLDTDDLSTVRGSSLTLLHAPRLLSRHLAKNVPRYREILCAASELLFAVDDAPMPVELVNVPNLRKISPRPSPKEQSAIKGALESAAMTLPETPTRELLFELATIPGLESLLDQFGAEKVAGMILKVRLSRTDKVRPETDNSDASEQTDIARIIQEVLSKSCTESGIEWPLDLFRFEVAKEPEGKVATTTLANLDSAMNQSQWRHLTCPIPPLQGTRPCAYNPMLPASGEKVKKKNASASVRRRREAGRKSKSSFYNDVLERGLSHMDEGAAAFDGARQRIEDGKNALGAMAGFAEDFDGIYGGAAGVDLSPSAKSSLAVIAFDGNGFGGHARDAMHTQGFDGLRTFSKGIEAMSAAMLGDVLSFVANSEAMRRDGVARFETLLWGADEFRFVVPGWAAWTLAQQIHASLANWHHPTNGAALTFGMGIAIAKGKMPIRDLSGAAYALSEAAGNTNKKRSLTQVHVFEGVDRVHLSAEKVRAAWLNGRKVPEGTFSMDRAALAAVPRLMKDLKARVGLTALREWTVRHADRLGASSDEIDEDFWKEVGAGARRIASGEFDVRAVLENHAASSGHAAYPMLGLANVAMLHDYLPEGF